MSALHDSPNLVPPQGVGPAASRVRGESRRAVDLDGSSRDTPRKARGHVKQVLTTWAAPPALIDRLTIIVSELATNAICHGDGPRITVLVARTADLIEVSVYNAGLVAVPLRASLPDQNAEGGRGLAEIAGYADLWGHRVDGTRTLVVWAACRLPHQSAPASEGGITPGRTA